MTLPRPQNLRPFVVFAALVAASLACERAEVPITPATPLVNTPVVLPSDTPTPSATPTDTATPTATLNATQLAALDTPTHTPIPPTPTNTLTPSPTATRPTNTPTPIPPTATKVIRTATPTGPPGTATPTATKGGKPAATPTPTETPVPGTIPDYATFTQKFTVRPIGGKLLNAPKYLADGQTATWASLRDGGGNEYWSLEFSLPEKITGVRLKAYADGGQLTQLQTIEVSGDGQIWLTVFTAKGSCGTFPCDVLPTGEFVDYGWNAVTVQFVRLRGGTSRFAFSEVVVATVP